ncbi:hypothetical protein OG225_33675 [Nocardia sp. NBC_01377]|uniref:hypothetical protein n=1 Tax=Nocardia sp. NBC_01377 TaxID=2903595 RepID=UPI003250FEDD
MTGPDKAIDRIITPVSGFVSESDVLDRIVARLLVVGPFCWEHLILHYQRVGENDFGGCSGFAYLVNADVPYPWVPSTDVSELFEYLRQMMARPERGTWLEVKFTMSFADEYSIEYNRGAQELQLAPDANDIRRELELFPRTQKHIPGWMQAILEGGDPGPGK